MKVNMNWLITFGQSKEEKNKLFSGCSLFIPSAHLCGRKIDSVFYLLLYFLNLLIVQYIIYVYILQSFHTHTHTHQWHKQCFAVISGCVFKTDPYCRHPDCCSVYLFRGIGCPFCPWTDQNCLMSPKCEYLCDGSVLLDCFIAQPQVLLIFRALKVCF